MTPLLIALLAAAPVAERSAQSAAAKTSPGKTSTARKRAATRAAKNAGLLGAEPGSTTSSSLYGPGGLGSQRGEVQVGGLKGGECRSCVLADSREGRASETPEVAAAHPGHLLITHPRKWPKGPDLPELGPGLEHGVRRFESCFEAQLSKNAPVPSRVWLTLDVMADGQVKAATSHVEGDYFHQLERCVKEVAHSLQFAATAGGERRTAETSLLYQRRAATPR